MHFSYRYLWCIRIRLAIDKTKLSATRHFVIIDPGIYIAIAITASIAKGYI